SLISSQVAPGLTQIGVMLPYAPLYELLLHTFQKPIVATSGNISNSPIVFQDNQALAELPEIADFLLTNNREIVIPQDDSVIKFSPFKKEKIVLRRSRGLAPTYINSDLILPEACILATGAMLKSSFGFLHEGNTYLSQYLGDLAHFDTLENYRHTIEHFFRLFNAKPEVILCDKHPDYPSTRYAEEMAASFEIPVHHIQHHIAHFGAVLGENNQIESKTPVLGVIWDGTGLGDDGQIWGGEFFIYENYSFHRAHHFTYFDSILGDKMAREPRISALAACRGIESATELLKGKFTPTEWKIYTKILSGGTRLQTSSVGRIFDAVAALLDLKDIQSYEGEAALLLEQLATEYCKKNGLGFLSSYSYSTMDILSTKGMLREIIEDIQQGESPAFIAAKLHFSLAEMIGVIARKKQIKKIAFSGGVFQNGLLVDLIWHLLGDEFELFFHRQLSPNDENIAFGQMVCYEVGLFMSSDNHRIA
ncbi:MAG: carbamoyltransferase HypF, partial [Bacteroidetes bacterium]|nr:carbamoyltransferase HypF [Bacteroidota bacterium]